MSDAETDNLLSAHRKMDSWLASYFLETGIRNLVIDYLWTLLLCPDTCTNCLELSPRLGSFVFDPNLCNGDVDEALYLQKKADPHLACTNIQMFVCYSRLAASKQFCLQCQRAQPCCCCLRKVDQDRFIYLLGGAARKRIRVAGPEIEEHQPTI